MDEIRVALIGCGDRGTGAVLDCWNAAEGVVLWAMGDLFPDRLDASEDRLRADLGAGFQVAEDRKFCGWDAYAGVLQTECDIVLLTTPPAFRPRHLAAAVEAAKHVFMEKPAAVDAPGVRSVIESGERARAKGLSIVAGTQRRHDPAYQECIEKIHGGAIGEVLAAYAAWNQSGLWLHPRKPEWSDVEWQLRNWIYFAWTGGDHIVEQHVHNLDVINWVMRGHPVKAVGLGGRQVRTDPAYGHVFDHFAVEYEYSNGVRMSSLCRQIDGAAARIGEWVVGTEGTSNCNTSIKGASPWRWDGDRPNAFVEEHKTLLSAVRNGQPVNQAQDVAEATMTAILGREACYSGLEVTWDVAMSSDVSLVPQGLEFGNMPMAPVAVPGVTRPN